MGRPAALALCAVLLVAPIVGIAGGASAAIARPSPCVASVSIGVSSLSVVPSPNESVRATTYAIIHVQKPAQLTVHLVLAASTDNEWAAVVSPGSLVVSGGEEDVGVELAVLVPAGAPARSEAHATLTVEPDGGIYPCEGSAAPFTVKARPNVETFGGQIDPLSLDVADGGRRVAFRIELLAVANTQVNVSIEYAGIEGLLVDAPRSAVLNPERGGFDNASLDVRLWGPTLQPGQYQFTIKVTGVVDGMHELVGYLGMLIYIPAPKPLPAAPALPPVLLSWVGAVLLVLVLGTCVLVAVPLWSRHRARRRWRARRELARYRRSA